jgi:hypothetical protein
MSDIDDLMDEVVTEAKNVAESYEWGTSSGAAEKALDEAKTALRARITELEADRDSESRWAKEYLARAERAEQDADRLAKALNGRIIRCQTGDCEEPATYTWSDEDGEEFVCEKHKQYHFYAYGPSAITDNLESLAALKKHNEFIDQEPAHDAAKDGPP